MDKFKIKFGTCIKIGAGFYIGWSLARNLDSELGRVATEYIKEHTNNDNTQPNNEE